MHVSHYSMDREPTLILMEFHGSLKSFYLSRCQGNESKKNKIDINNRRFKLTLELLSNKKSEDYHV